MIFYDFLTKTVKVGKINPTNLIKFRSTEDAIKAGFIPCKVCKPPMTSR